LGDATSLGSENEAYRCTGNPERTQVTSGIEENAGWHCERLVGDLQHNVPHYAYGMRFDGGIGDRVPLCSLIVQSNVDEKSHPVFAGLVEAKSVGQEVRKDY